MIYTLEQLKQIVEPVAKKHNLKSLWVFGSYARGEATEDSDIDILMDYSGSVVFNLFDYNDVNGDLEIATNKKVDLLSTADLFHKYYNERFPRFTNNIKRERLLIYERT